MIKFSARLHLQTVKLRIPLLVAIANACACAETLERPTEPYAPVRLDAFSEDAARAACPNGYKILWRETCRDNTRYDAALVLCKTE